MEKRLVKFFVVFSLLLSYGRTQVFAEEGSTTESNENESEGSKQNEDQNENDDTDTLIDELDISREQESIVEKYDQQTKNKNSISMLNYLTVLSQEIIYSKNSRLFLEEASSAIVNNTKPEMVDELTKNQIDNLLDIIENLRMIDVKRERLNYLYEQKKAQAIRSAVPNPISILNVMQSFSLKKLVVSGLYLVVDSVTSYETYKNQMDLEYLKDGWELDDEEAKIIANNRKSTFNYMVEMVNDNNISGEYTLNEESVEELVKWKNNSNIVSRIRFLKDNEETYREYGGYWLILAKSYFDNGDYQKCIDAVKTYEEKQGAIFRKDQDFAKVLPCVIVAIQETVTNRVMREKEIKHYIELLIANTKNKDWDLRYFAAMTYLELSIETNNNEYLEKAFSVARSNVNYLAASQKSKNAEYMADVVKKEYPKNVTKEQKKEINQYNNLIKEERKISLPPVSEALLLNCDLMFALAKKIEISQKDKDEINSILHLDNTPLFLNSLIDKEYWFDKSKELSFSDILFDKRILYVPAVYLVDDYNITVTVEGMTGNHNYDEWIIRKVDRKNKNDVTSFIAELECKEIKQYKYEVNDIVTIKITPTQIIECDPVVLQYKAVNKKLFFVLDSVELERIE